MLLRNGVILTLTLAAGICYVVGAATLNRAAGWAAAGGALASLAFVYAMVTRRR